VEKELFTFIAGGTAGAGIRKAGAVAGYILQEWAEEFSKWKITKVL